MATIQGIYVALFGRPADPKGLSYFDGITNHGADLVAIGNLAGQSEYLARFTGMSNVQIVNSIYQSLFSRDGEKAGLDFWAEKLASGALTINTIAIAILDGAQGIDRQTADAKIAAADQFTKILTPEQTAAYNGSAATAEIKGYLAKVTADHPGVTGDIAIVAIHLIPVSDPDTTGSTPTPPPASTIFTTGTDAITTTDGTVFYTAKLGTGATLTAGDSFHGAGNELSITDQDSVGNVVMPGGLHLSGISTIDLTTGRNIGGASDVFDVSGVTGLTQFNLSASGTGVDSLKSASTIAIDGTTDGTSFSVQGGFSSLNLTGAGHLASLGLSDGSFGALSLHLSHDTAFTLDMSGTTLSGGFSDSDNHITSLTIAGSTANTSSIDAIGSAFMTSLTVSGNVVLGSSGAFVSLPNTVNSVDMSGVTTSSSDTSYIQINRPSVNLTIGAVNVSFNGIAGANISMAGATGLTHDTSSSTINAFLANAAAHAGSAIWAEINGNTYLAESATGTLGAGDTTFIELIGSYMPATSGGHVVIF